MKQQQNWLFKMPVTVRFGFGEAERLGQAVPEMGSRPVLVTDRRLAELESVKAVAAAVAPVAVFQDVNPNPTVTNVDQLAAVLRAERADVVIAAGGGSVIDCAKAACSLVKSEESSVRAYHTGGKTFSAEHVPLIAVPTTAGTGSEVTPFAVLDDTELGVKGPIAADAFYPALAVVDPQLTLSLPTSVTASTGLDALSHALEGYWSKNHQPLCDTMAMEAARLIFVNLPAVYRDPTDADARGAMSYAALLAGMAFQLPKNAMVHACSFPLSNRFHMPHGVACAFTLEFALKLNATVDTDRLNVLAEHCGFRNTDDMADAIRVLKVDGGLPCTLADAKIPADAVPALIEDSFHPLMKNNPVEVSPEDLRRMYAELAG